MLFRSVRATALIVLVLGAGCRGEPSLEDIEGWIRAGQFTKVNEYVANKAHPMDKRIDTVRKLVEYGQTTEVQTVLEGVDDRQEFVGKTVDTLLEDMNSGDEAVRVESKDALFILMAYLSDEQQSRVQAAIAAWAFEGLGPESTRDELVRRIERYGLIGQLNRMGEHGIPVAAWLVSHGVETMSLGNYLAEAKTPESQRVVIEAVKRLFSMKNLVVPWEILDVARRYAIPETVEFLVDVYLNDSFPDAARSSALAAGQDLVYGVGAEDGARLFDTPEKKGRVLKAVTRLLGSNVATDRWDAADMLWHVGGWEQIDTIIGGLKADLASYVRVTPEDELEMPDLVIIQTCREKLRPHAARVRPRLEAWLGKGDAVQKAFSILCLKVIGAPASIEALASAKGGEESLEDFFFSTEERKRRTPLIKEGTIPELTVGVFAQNAIDGIKLLTEIEAARAAGKMDEREAELRAQSAVSVIGFFGEQFTAAVEGTYQKKASRSDGSDSYDEEGQSDASD